MWYLREGLVVAGSVEGALELVDIDSGPVRGLEGQAARAALALGRGLEGVEARRAGDLIGAEWLEEREEPFDRRLRRRLADLDEELSWAWAPGSRPLVALAELCHSALRHARPELDQHPAMPETAARRALELRARAGAGARVALVGDDDLVALPAAALGLDVTVLDLDEDLLALEALLAARLGLVLDVVRSDLREPLAAELRGRFDAFCTDAEPTRECVVLFVSRGLALLRPGGLGLVSCSEEFEGLLDDAARDMGLARLGLHRRFSSYRTVAGRLSPYRSDLHVLGASGRARPLVPADRAFAAELFPFGLAGGDHLLVVAEGCPAEALEGERLVELARELASGGAGDARVGESWPMPVRILRAEGAAGLAQLAVRPDRTTVDLDLAPAPADEPAAERVLAAVARALAEATLRARALRRIDEPDEP